MNYPAQLLSVFRWTLLVKIALCSSEHSSVSLLTDDRISGVDFQQFGLATRHSYFAEDFDIGNSADENPWTEWVQELVQTTDIRGSIQKALDTPRWWLAWEHLHPSTRNKVIEDVMPLLLGGKGGEWKLHCSDAYKLCQVDKNCHSKFWNFVSSCSSGEGSQVVRRMFNIGGGYRESLSRRRIARSLSASRRARMRARARRRHKMRSSKRFRRPVKMFRPRKMAAKYLYNWMGQRWKKVFYKRLPSHDEETCPPKCVQALILLNNTIYSSLLARCDCALDSLLRRQENATQQNSFTSEHFPHARQHLYGTESSTIAPTWNEGFCRRHQSTARKCRPRLFLPRGGQIGCTEARIRCEHKPKCRKAQKRFLRKCSQVINGLKCTRACSKAIIALKKASRHFSTCVCDGVEGKDCRNIRSNIYELCRCPSALQQFRGTWPLRNSAKRRLKCRDGRNTEKRLPTIANVSNDSNRTRKALKYLSTMLLAVYAMSSLKY